MAAAPGDNAKIKVVVEKPDGIETEVVLNGLYGELKQNQYDKDLCKFFAPKGPPLSGGCTVRILIDPVAAFTLDFNYANVLHMDFAKKGRSSKRAYQNTYEYTEGAEAADVVCIPGQFVQIWSKTIDQGMIARAGWRGPDGTGRFQIVLMSI